ncbi:MAG: UDP-N-acetylglucosamine--LPS N-acetylglucosamine transferase [Actinobacteria bacterium]|nr:UDP-N-acetylglucosamine--LPS N-acetylglucosamine transferase [Actinomycetota bacterium]
MTKPTIILATSNGVGMGHLARASAVAMALKPVANPIIVSMAGGIAEIPSFMDIRCEYIPGRDRLWMSREKWDAYLRDRLLALVDETDAKVLSFDGVVPYPGVIAARNANPKLKLVWVRRGLWQKKPQRFILGLQAKMMDAIVEPGDIARAYDFGPTSKRKDSVLTSPVSLFRKEDALSRADARKALGLDQNRPVALVQLGTGDSDVNHKMTAALEGLLGWKDLQVILTKAPVDKDGNSLAPEGVKKLQDPQVRAALSAKCAELPQTTGGQEIADILYALATKQAPAKAKTFTFIRLMAQDHINRGLRHVANLGLRRVALVYRFLNPHIVVQVTKQDPPTFGDSTDSAELHKLIKSASRFEHLITGASPTYVAKRKEIAKTAYGDLVEIIKK